MTDVFVSYARETKPRVGGLVDALEADGRSVWWDDSLRGGEFFGATIEDKINEAKSVLVAWSSAARRSVWVQGEALEALDAGKLVQISIDWSRPPIPFNALHVIDFAAWNGSRHGRPWDDLKASLDAPTRVLASESHQRRSLLTRAAYRNHMGSHGIAGLTSAWASGVSGLAVFLVQSEQISYSTFTLICGAAFVASILAITSSIVTLWRTDTSMKG